MSAPKWPCTRECWAHDRSASCLSNTYNPSALSGTGCGTGSGTGSAF